MIKLVYLLTYTFSATFLCARPVQTITGYFTCELMESHTPTANLWLCQLHLTLHYYQRGSNITLWGASTGSAQSPTTLSAGSEKRERKLEQSGVWKACDLSLTIKHTYTHTYHIPPLLLVGSSNDSFSLGQRQEMSKQLTKWQEEREVATSEKVDKEMCCKHHLLYRNIYAKQQFTHSFFTRKDRYFPWTALLFHCSCPNVKNRAHSAQLWWEEWIKPSTGIKEDKLMLTLGCNDSNFLSLCASIHSLPHNKWMEMRGNKRMRWNHFQRHYIYFPPISLIKCCALLMITSSRTH